MFTEFAPAKVNLTLHITGQRADGYHLLDSVVMFASVGDVLVAKPAQTHSLSVDGPRAEGVPDDAANSILQVAARFVPEGQAAAFTLTKNLPTAAGIGGGTADAAAALRLIHRMWPDGPAKAPITDVAQSAILGADVPVCVRSVTARMRGIGERVERLSGLPTLHAVLVNPGVAVSTPAVFKTMSNKQNDPMEFPIGSDFIAWLRAQRNDMQDVAVGLAPVIGQVLKALDQSEFCDLTRMSGSGATCFGLYPNAQAASDAAASLSSAHPDWWVTPCTLN